MQEDSPEKSIICTPHDLFYLQYPIIGFQETRQTERAYIYEKVKTMMEVAAHRGTVEGVPENTMPAFESAYALGVDMIELDLHMTKDGEIVVIHDPTVDRTSDGHGLVSDMTLSELKRLDFGIRTDAKFQGTRIPTFREFLELTRRDDKMQFNFEFKDYIHDKGEAFALESASKTIAFLKNTVLRTVCSSTALKAICCFGSTKPMGTNTACMAIIPTRSWATLPRGMCSTASACSTHPMTKTVVPPGMRIRFAARRNTMRYAQRASIPGSVQMWSQRNRFTVDMKTAVS